MSNELSKRRAFLLATIVYEYIQTAEPVGSNTLTQKYQLGVSSATIRNEMAELEAAGYLVQPHTSSGRVPSDVGYRTYVDQLMTPVALDGNEQRRIRDELRAASTELGGIIDHATRLLGRLTQSFTFTVAPRQDSTPFRHVQLIWFSPRSGLAIVVTTLGVAAQHAFELAQDIDADALTRLSNHLNASLGGRRLHDITHAVVSDVVQACGLPADLTDVVTAALEDARGDEHHVTSSGAQHLLDQPEFRDLRKLRSILTIVEEQKALYDLVAQAISSEQPYVKIGQELGDGDFAECSLIAMPYRMGEDAIGMLALLGPRRMPYAKLLAIMAGTAASLTHRLGQDG